MKLFKKIKKIIPVSMMIEIFLIVVVVVGIGAYFVHNHIVAMNEPPVFKIEAESDIFSVKATEKDLLDGVVATDKEDGNVTESIIIEGISQFFDDNKRTVTYVAFDSDNNVTKFNRDIKYSDYEAPKFTNKTRIYVPKGTASEILSEIKVEDKLDGDLSSQVRLEINTVVTGIPGEYPVRASVTNSAGDVATKDIIVTVTGEE